MLIERNCFHVIIKIKLLSFLQPTVEAEASSPLSSQNSTGTLRDLNHVDAALVFMSEDLEHLGHRASLPIITASATRTLITRDSDSIAPFASAISALDAIVGPSCAASSEHDATLFQDARVSASAALGRPRHELTRRLFSDVVSHDV